MLRRLKKRKVDVAAGRSRGLATGHNAESHYYLITAGKAIFFYYYFGCYWTFYHRITFSLLSHGVRNLGKMQLVCKCSYGTEPTWVALNHSNIPPVSKFQGTKYKKIENSKVLGVFLSILFRPWHKFIILDRPINICRISTMKVFFFFLEYKKKKNHF